MKNVGILAAMTLAEVGSVSDVKGFFNLIVSLLEKGVRGSKYPYVTEKLYRKSLSYKDLCEVKVELDSIEKELSCISNDNIEWLFFGVDKCNSRLDFEGENLSVVFKHFFKAFDEALECTEVYYQGFNEYIPVRVGFTDAPYYIDDVNRASDEYDSLGPNDPPFWLR